MVPSLIASHIYDLLGLSLRKEGERRGKRRKQMEGLREKEEWRKEVKKGSGDERMTMDSQFSRPVEAS